MSDIIERLRKTASRGVSVWGDLQMEAADEIETLRGRLALPAPAPGIELEVEDLSKLVDRLGGILSRTAIALRGPEPPLTRWSWHDLPELVDALKDEIAVLRLRPYAAQPVSAPAEVAPPGWRDALQFYADGNHFNISGDPSAWDTISGEPTNFWCDEAGTATMEDGTVAKMALAGTPLPHEDDEERRLLVPATALRELDSSLMQAVESILEDGHMNQEHLARLRAAWEGATTPAMREPLPVSARPASEYHEDHGAVLWWTFPINEPPYCGQPSDDDWPAYHTHWTPLVLPGEPGSAHG